MGSGMDSGEVDGSGSSEVDSTILAQIFLLAVPLLSAPVAFYFNSKQASNYSLGLEFLIIGVLVLEFLILVVLKSGAFSERGIYPDSVSIERFEVSLICDKCGEHFRYSLSEKEPNRVTCYRCGNSNVIRINDTYDGIIHTETPSP